MVKFFNWIAVGRLIQSSTINAEDTMYTDYRITSRKEKKTMYHCSCGACYANFLITYSSNRDEKIKEWW